MHWEDHTFALPSPGKGKRWRKIFSTTDREGFLGEESVICQERKAMIEARSVAVFTGETYETTNTKKK